jgi:glycyl-tRNA synthetase beta chain
MNTPPLLIELLTEELPPKNLRALAEAFAKGLTKDLRQSNFLSTNSEYVFFVTPRRLSLRINDVFAESRSSDILVKGPSVTVGLDAQGKPTPALLGFAKKRGVAAETLERVHDGKQEIFAHRELSKGSLLRDCLGSKIQAALQDLPIPKLMGYQLDNGKTTVKFVRPAHRLVVLHGTEVVPCTVLGLAADRVTEGHRFQSRTRTITIAHVGEYEKKLETEGAVIANFDQRRAVIEKQLRVQAQKLGATLGAEKDIVPLLDEVTALVEWPAVYVGTFESEFLKVPQECLVLAMRTHQKYFPLFVNLEKLTNKFLIVSNMRLDDPKFIIEGNQRVVRPRLADARFFYETDKKIKLADRVPQLANIVYHNKLGSQGSEFDRVQRIQKLASMIADKLGTDTKQVERAAYLCKADLSTNMVGEFPELQGVMGEYYALNDGESILIARAIREHYYPRFANDVLPKDSVGTSVALADKLETLAGMFGIGNQPTGDKDPFALRRNALGVVRILIEKKINVGVLELVGAAIDLMPPLAKSDWLPIVEFILDRARYYFSEQGYAKTAIEAVLGPLGNVTWLHTLPEIIAEASQFIATEEGKNLAEANKRITNILKKSGCEVPFGVAPDQLPVKPNPTLFKDKAEIHLWDALQKTGVESLTLKRQQRFAESLRVLSQLGIPVKAFFDGVMVNTEDQDVRENRITLLQHARAYMNQVADLSLMVS